MAIYNWICTTLSYSGLELVTFVLVDAVVKSPLRDAVNDGEKRTIWLYESVGLGLICFIVYLFHHMPYLLILLTCVTFAYTQLLGRTGFTNILADLRAHWENHLQHEESMKQIEHQKHLQQQQAHGMASYPAVDISNLSGQNEQGYGMNFPFFTKQTNLQYPPNATVVPGQNTPTYSLNPSSGTYRDVVKQSRGIYTTYTRNWNNVANTNYSNINTHHALSALNSVPAPYDSTATSLQRVNSNTRRTWTSQNLPRRSLHPDTVSKVAPKPFSSSSIKSKVMNVIGFGPSTIRPVGLVNYGENLCFMNSVVQCLARGPFLAESLTAISAKELECTVFESQLLSTLAELLDNLTLPPDESHHPVSSVAKFRQACSNLHPQLVTPPGQHMRQQDAAEFLMWLMATLHGILNKNRRALDSDPANEDRLASLKQIYGDLTANRIHELKEQCRKDIAAANGLENESYAEAIQRLSDLEWLIYKQANDTLIDSLFSGQLVEAYHGVNHSSISVNLQTFNVLPVPIGDPVNVSGLVSLDECFARFCNIENLTELPANGTDKPFVRTEQQVTASGLARYINILARATPVTRPNFRLAKESDVAYLPSPIQASILPIQTPGPFISQTFAASPPPQSVMRENIANDSGFLDNTFRTSTPVVVSRQPDKIQRRCLLRQLPECLIIQLMRFRYDPVAGIATKVSTAVSIRLRDFNLQDVIYDTVMQRSDMTAPNVGYVYELYGLCLHLGADSTAHGHYVSYCLDHGRWYRMDDQNVLEVNMEYQLSTEEIRQNAYILFYRRTSGHV